MLCISSKEPPQATSDRKMMVVGASAGKIDRTSFTPLFYGILVHLTLLVVSSTIGRATTSVASSCLLMCGGQLVSIRPEIVDHFYRRRAEGEGEKKKGSSFRKRLK